MRMVLAAVLCGVWSVVVFCGELPDLRCRVTPDPAPNLPEGADMFTPPLGEKAFAKLMARG